MAHKSVGVQDVAAGISGAKVVAVPDAWIEGLPDNRNVFASLYTWLIAEHGALDARHDLHTRTFAGAELMKRLIAAETKRIRRRHKLTGPKLKSAVSWNNMDSGPMESWRGAKLRGDALFIVPAGTQMNGDRLL